MRILQPLGQTGNPYLGGDWGGDTLYGDYFVQQGFDLYFKTEMQCP